MKFSLLAATVAAFAVPAAAHGEYLVPPSNSAATQYTEAVPTAGGPKATNKSRRGEDRSPSKVLGARNAKQLESQGAAGRAAAEVAAATAPSGVSFAAGGSQAGDRSASQRGSHAGDGSADNGSAGQGTGNASGGEGGQQAALAAQQVADGSSGLGEVIGQATGSSSSGQLGLLLPLIVLGALAWSLAFVLRQRKRPTN